MYVDPDQPTPAACAIGAIRMAVCGTPATTYLDGQAIQVSRALRSLAGHLDIIYGHYWGADEAGQTADPDRVVADWNDEPDRTAVQVITALNDAADTWDRTHGGAP
jgi:hypothetical protein